MKLSFSIPSKSSSSSRPNSIKTSQSFAAQPAEDGEPQTAEDGEPQPQFVTVFDPSKSLSDAPDRRVIPPIPNDDRLVKKMKNLIPPPSDDDPVPSETHFVLDTTSADPTAIPYGLTIRSNSATAADPNPQDQEGGDGGRQRKTAKDRLDLSGLSDDCGHEDIPIGEFGAAILAGYGWSEGKGIGRNNKVGDTKVAQYERRAQNAGLGYVPSANDPKAWKRKMRAMEHDKKKPDLRQSDSEKIEHDKKKPDLRQSDSEKIVRVISGRHAGQKGKVVERSGRKIRLKLLQSSEEVQVGQDMVVELGSAADVRDRDERKEERRSRDSGREEKSSRDERRYRDEEAKPVEKSSGGGGGDRWLTSHIRVRIISRDFRGGKLYKQKGEVVDVVGPRTCDITMDGSGELVQGVDQEMLETALPKRGGSVLVLYGKHKGVFGSLMERDMEEETGVVRDADSHALISVQLDQIAEYVGDPSYLGY